MFGLRSKCPRIAWSAEQASWLETLRRDKEINKAAVIQKLLQPFQPFHAMAVGHRSINLKWLKRKAFRMENDPGGFTRWLVAYISLVHGPYKPTNTTGGWAPLCRFGFQNPTWNWVSSFKTTIQNPCATVEHHVLCVCVCVNYWQHDLRWRHVSLIQIPSNEDEHPQQQRGCRFTVPWHLIVSGCFMFNFNIDVDNYWKRANTIYHIHTHTHYIYIYIHR